MLQYKGKATDSLSLSLSWPCSEAAPLSRARDVQSILKERQSVSIKETGHDGNLGN
jgi:hypothetical protein